MTLRRRLLLYLVAIHAVFMATGIAVLVADFRMWILALEAVLVFSFLFGWYLIRSLKAHEDLSRIGGDFIRERDFSHTFTADSSSDVNRLVRLYNEMITCLREERLRAQEQQALLEKVLAASPTGLITLDHDRNIESMNPAARRFLALADSDSFRRPLSSVNHELARRLNLLPVGTAGMLDIGSAHKVKCIHSQFMDRGFPRSFFLIVEMTDELWSSEKQAYERIIRILSHEVNNTVGAANSILRSCLLYGEQLRSEDRQDFVSALNVAVERNDHLNKFMRSYADVVRLPNPSRQKGDVGELVQRTLRLLKNECEEKFIEIAFSAESGIAPVFMDIAQMEQVLINILRNSIEAIGSSGKITVSLMGKEEGFSLIIEDTGPGIPPAIQENLFIPFFSTKENGQGIGLTLVREILSRHGFDYSLTSSPDQPTRFTIVFPAHKPAEDSD